MVAYSFDKFGIYTGVVSIQNNPRKKGEYLVPSNATLVEPPSLNSYGSDKIPMFNLDSREWELVDSPQKIMNERQKLELQNEYGISLYEEDAEGNIVLRDQVEVDQLTDEARNIDLAHEAKSTCEKNIAIKALTMTNTTNIESAKAEISGWQLRREVPEEYVDDNIVVIYPVTDYPVDSLLDNPVAINEYFTKLAVEMDKYRISEIQAYEQVLSDLGFTPDQIV